VNAQARSAAARTGGTLGGILAAGAGLTLYALAVEPYRLQVTHTEIECPRLPASMDGLTVLLLADSHISRHGRRERLLADLLADLPVPDIAVLGGDIITGTGGVPDAMRLIQGNVRSRYGTYAILGNAEHKLRGPRRRDFVSQLDNAGVVTLINRSMPLEVNGATITVAGTDDPYFGHADLETTLAEWDRGRFCLLLAHSPQIVTLAARAGVDLMLSGHTHGGQVRLPFLGALETHNPLGRGVDQGLFDRARLQDTLGRDPGGDTLLYISRGIGVANFANWPLYPRLLCRPEVAWITLRRVDAR